MHQEVNDRGAQALDFSLHLHGLDIALREADLRENFLKLPNLCLQSFFDLSFVVQWLPDSNQQPVQISPCMTVC
jgi:hypothetical protein